MVAWLFTLTSVWLPWWVVRYTDSAGNPYDTGGVLLWRPVDEFTTAWGAWLTGMLVAVLAVWLFVRIAAKSWEHEPRMWRRDLWATAGLASASLISTMFWPDPDNFKSFWGGVTYRNETTGTWFTQTVIPGLGWWCMIVAFLCLISAAVLAQRQLDDASGK